MKKQILNGWIIVDKPLGMTSTQVVNKVKWLFRPKKIGHTGTLDPEASGILPLALGEATKAVNFMMESTKEYVFTAQWGSSTTTDDAEGDVVEASDSRPTKDEILALLSDFVGEINQMPPQFSALKVDGKRAYDLARQGEKVALKSRTVRIDQLELLEAEKDQAIFRVSCGKGTYVRSIARDLGVKLGCFAHVIQLRRTKVGPFGEKDAFSLDFLEEKGHSARNSEEISTEDVLQGVLLDIRQGLDDIPALSVTAPQMALLKNGGFIPRPANIDEQGVKTGDLIRAECEETLIGFCKVEDENLKPVRIFNL